MLDKTQLEFAENALRRASYKWMPRRNILNKARRDKGEFAIKIEGDRCKIKYRCAMCKLLFRKKEIQLDHIEPVIPIEGRDDLEGFASRLLCYEEGWQVLCKNCHKDKSNEENRQR